MRPIISSINKRRLLTLLTSILILGHFSQCTQISRNRLQKKELISSHPYSARWDFGPPTSYQSALLDRVSSSTFSLLAEDHICYMFCNEEKNLILKIFKQRPMKFSKLLAKAYMPREIKMLYLEKVNRCQRYRTQLFSGYQIAYERFREHTTLLFVHLNRTTTIKKHVTIKEQGNTTCRILLDDVEFTIQKYPIAITEYLLTTITQNQLDEAKTTIRSLIRFLAMRNRCGFEETQSGRIEDLGILDGVILQMNPENLHLTKPSTTTAALLEASTRDLTQFLHTHAPQLAAFLDTEIDNHSQCD